MPLYLVEAPGERVLELGEVKSHLRVDVDDDDDLISDLILAAEERIDGRDGWLGRALVSQRWDLRLDTFRGSGIAVPLPPLIEVEQVTYIDASGGQQTLDASVYQVVGAGGWGPGCVALRDGQSWPDTDLVREAVTVRFRAGYRDTASSPPAGDVPRPVRRAMLQMIAAGYMQREDIVVRGSAMPIPDAAEVVLAQYQVHHFP